MTIKLQKSEALTEGIKRLIRSNIPLVKVWKLKKQIEDRIEAFLTRYYMMGMEMIEEIPPKRGK